MTTCEDLVIVDRQVVRPVLSSFNVCPQMMQPLNSFGQFESRMKFDKHFSEAYFSLKNYMSFVLHQGLKSCPTTMAALASSKIRESY